MNYDNDHLAFRFLHIAAYHGHMRRQYEAGNDMKSARAHESSERWYFSLSFAEKV